MRNKITKLFGDLFKKKNESKTLKRKAIQSMASDVIAKPKTALELAQEKIMKERVRLHNEKIEKLGEEFSGRLNEFLSTYFNNFSEDKDANDFAYDVLNKEWKSYVNKRNTLQKIIQIKHDAFEVEVARIISENPQFQTVTDLTKI